MNVLIANHSSYPSPDANVAAAVAAQMSAGVDLVTDGQVHWADPISHVMQSMSGVQFAGTRRFFDSAVEYRQPVVTARLARGASVVVGDCRAAVRAAGKPVKAVLTGPYTLARLSLIETGAYQSYRELAHDLSQILADEVRGLAAAGAGVIQLDEPAICQHPEDIRLLRELFEPIYDARGDAEMAIASYFLDSEPLYPPLNSIPADIVALDLPSSPRLGETIAATGASKILALGVVDGRSPRMEDAQTIARQLVRWLRRYTLDTVCLQPSCGLVQLSLQHARAKLQLLAAIRTAFLELSPI